MKLVGIARVSTDQQVGENGEGLARQRNALGIIAANHGADLTIVEIRGVSGAKVADSPEWQRQVVPLLESGCDIAADSLDRIARPEDFDYGVFATLVAHSAKIYTPNGVEDPKSPSGQMLITFQAAMAGRERMEITRRTQEGKAAMQKRGEWTLGQHRLPFGITWDKVARTWGYNEKAPRVKAAMEAYVGGQPANAVARELGVSKAGIRTIMANPIYKGIFAPGWSRNDIKVEVRVFGEGKELPQLVSDDLWNRVQANRQMKSKTYRTTNEATRKAAPFSGILRSLPTYELEGQHRVIPTEKKSDHPVYFNRSMGRYVCRCSCQSQIKAKTPGDFCGIGMLNAVEANKGILAYFQGMAEKSESLDYTELWTSLAEDALGVAAGRTGELQTTIKDIEAALERLLDLHLDGSITKEKYTEKAAPRELALQEAKIELAPLLAAPTITEEDVIKLQKSWGQLPAHIKAGTVREWAVEHFSEIYINNDGVAGFAARIPWVPGVVFQFGATTTWEKLGANIKTHKNTSRKVAARKKAASSK